jgi:nitrate/nitrite transport system ATP-binding protein
MTPFLELTQLGKSYPAPQGETVIVKDFNLRVAEGEFVCIIGHSGCGKSTVLSIAMGLNAATDGGVIVAGREVIGPGLDRGVVFQSPALLPWLTARENVLLALEQVSPDRKRKERRRSAEKYLALVGLENTAESYPDQLSAGMRQRVGIARAFALDPKVLLLDEPFSLLDVVTRMELQDELMRIWESDRKTVLMVTHDVDEALLLADRIVMMTNGPAATVGEILEVSFPRPRRRFEILNQPEYERLRDHLITFLEERANIRPEKIAPTPSKPNGSNGRVNHSVSDEERFVIQKYTGFNRFRAKYRVDEPKADRGGANGKAGVESP